MTLHQHQPSVTDQPPKDPAQPELSVDPVKLKKQAKEYLDGWKRAKADYLNLRKQAEKERQEVGQFVQAATVMEFIPVYDNLKRAVRHTPPDQKQTEWVKGLQHIQKQFEDLLEKMGLEPIETIGKHFDPNLHHAVSKVQQPGVPSGQIVDELKSGFKAGDRILQPADVVVAE